MEWLHEGCHSDLSADFLHFGANDFPSKNSFTKCFKILFFSLWRRDPSGFGAIISDAVARSSIVFYNSDSADRIVMAVLRLLRAVAALVILVSFAAGSRKSYWSGCMKAATWICQQIFSILGLVIFLLKILLKSVLKSSFFSLWRRDPVLELQFPTQLCVFLLCFATQSLQIALWWLRQGCLVPRLHAQYYCLLQLDFVNRIGVAASRVRQWLVVVLGID